MDVIHCKVGAERISNVPKVTRIQNWHPGHSPQLELLTTPFLGTFLLPVVTTDRNIWQRGPSYNLGKVRFLPPEYVLSATFKPHHPFPCTLCTAGWVAPGSMFWALSESAWSGLSMSHPCHLRTGRHAVYSHRGLTPTC